MAHSWYSGLDHRGLRHWRRELREQDDLRTAVEQADEPVCLFCVPCSPLEGVFVRRG